MNTEFKGTPGPWEFVPESEQGRYRDEDMGGFRSASGWICTFGDGRMYYPTEGTPPEPADALLIAAAPELLEELIKLVETFEPSGMYDDEVFAGPKAAIAKALGQLEEEEET